MKLLEIQTIRQYKGQPVTLIQEKLDGHYIEIYKSNGIKSYPKSRGSDIWPKLAKIKAIRATIEALPDETILQAELHCPGVHATSVPTMLNEGNEKLMLTPFAVPVFKGKSLNDWQYDLMPFDL